MDISRNYHLEDKVEYIIALVNEERMIRLSGVKGIEIRFTGLRDGEKLYEEVLNEDETSKPTFHPKIKIAQVRAYDYAKQDAIAENGSVVALSYVAAQRTFFG